MFWLTHIKYKVSHIKIFYDIHLNFRFDVDACSELNLRQANYLSSTFYLKFRFYTQ